MMAEGEEGSIAPVLQRAREAADAAGGTWPVKRELATELRRILEELPRSAADDATLRDCIAPLRDVAERLEAAGAAGRGLGEASSFAGMSDFMHVSPIVGFANPIAPPFHFEIDDEAKVARGRGAFGRVHEGGPGIVHGGLLAAAVDELLGMATVFSERPGMTGRLTLHYMHPTPIETELVMEARMDEVRGRRMKMSADVWAGDVRTARATALFISVPDEKFSDLEAKRQARQAE